MTTAVTNPGFTYLREERFSCGGVTHTAAIYRHDLAGLEFSLIPAGTFRMGSPSDESGRYSDETQHEVTLTKPFLMARTPCTQGAWKQVLDASSVPPSWIGDLLPVEEVPWEEAAEWCCFAGLSLPTEAQWEYACRAGTTTRFCGGDNPASVAWYDGNSGSKTHPVGEKAANAFGLYDVHGNVWEWCADWYGEYATGSVTDPTGPSTGSYRVYRGGSWNNNAAYCRAANRDRDTPGNRGSNLGFRPCFVLDEQPAEPQTEESEGDRMMRFFSESAHDRLPKRHYMGWRGR